jgi:predicted class III extradiol MEMO1 family dioxygenase
MKRLKTFESLFSNNYLEKTNEIKELLSYYNMKYQLLEKSEALEIIFPYAEAMYGGKYTDPEYDQIISFLKELNRYGFTYNVKETDETTTVTVIAR